MKAWKKSLFLVATGLVGSMVAPGCVSRPVATGAPSTKDLVTNTLSQQAIDKVDLLFAIDNSQSMGDKQALLASAVPQLVRRLVVPRCTNTAGDVRERAAATEACPAGFAPEFRAVDDIHVAVISSSLGGHGAVGKNTACMR